MTGYETTANALAYALISLALWPGVQGRVAAEIERVYQKAAAEGREELDYTSDFPELEYTYGFMVSRTIPLPLGFLCLLSIDLLSI